MLKKYPLSSFVKYAVAAAIVYSIPAAFFIKNEIYSQTWLLFMGNGFFLCVLLGFIFFYKNPNSNNTKLYPLFSGLIVTAMGVIISCILVSLIIILIKPSFFSISPSNSITHSPSSIQGLALMLYMDAIGGNAIAGAFASVMFFVDSRSNRNKRANLN